MGEKHELRLMISVTNFEEASVALDGGADIIDVKNPVEGALGANFPWVIRKIVQYFGERKEISATIGDIPNLPGTVTLAGLGIGMLGVNYIKFGIYGPKTEREAEYISKSLNKLVYEFGLQSKLVIAGYADYLDHGCLNPFLLPKIAFKSGLKGVLIDVKEKGSKSLFDFFSVKELHSFVEESHRFGLEVGLAGSLRKEDIPKILSIKGDIMGLRRNVCTLKGKEYMLNTSKMNEIKNSLKDYMRLNNYSILV